MHFRSYEKFLKFTKILKIKNKGELSGLFRYSAGQNDTSPIYFWSLWFETRSCRLRWNKLSVKDAGNKYLKADSNYVKPENVVYLKICKNKNVTFFIYKWASKISRNNLKFLRFLKSRNSNVVFNSFYFEILEQIKNNSTNKISKIIRKVASKLR